ncbi:MAG: aldehyde dehydrogenase [Treponema sp.]|nr:aldehyde dehydrogenase [Treponema sp.]
MSIHDIILRQREFYDTGATRSHAFRINALNSLRDALNKNEDLIFSALKKDLGKHPMETYMCESGMVLDEIRYHLKHLKTWMRAKKVKTPMAQFHAKSFISPEPYGIALIMTPWNYPVQLSLSPLVGAISAGNCVVLKPSAYAPNTSSAIAKIIGEAFRPEHIAVIEGGREENQELLKQTFDYIFFTGGIAVGKTVMEAASKNLTPITLELGGKSPVIVDSTSDLKLAAKRIAFGKVLNAGQTCVGPDYLFIEESKLEKFIDEFKNALNEFFPGGDMSSMPLMVNEKHFRRVTGLIQGQKIAIGGNSDSKRLFIEPTVLIDVPPGSPIMNEEIFGPVLPVMTYKKIDECINFIRSRPKPLALYLFTSDKSTEQLVLNNCSFGGGCINDTVIHLATPYMGFGGVGESGMGGYHGKRSFDTFTHYRSIVRKSTWIDLKMRYHPYTEGNLKMIRMFLK